jgi:hypothetical protein
MNDPVASNQADAVASDIERADKAVNPTFMVAGKEYPMPQIKARSAINYMKRAAAITKKDIDNNQRLMDFADMLDDFITDCEIEGMDALTINDVMTAFNSFFEGVVKQMGGTATAGESSIPAQTSPN